MTTTHSLTHSAAAALERTIGTQHIVVVHPYTKLGYWVRDIHITECHSIHRSISELVDELLDRVIETYNSNVSFHTGSRVLNMILVFNRLFESFGAIHR